MGKGFFKPTIKVYLLPGDWTEEQYQQYFNSLVSTASAIPSLNVESEKDIIILFPKDAMTYGLGTEILVEIDLHLSMAGDIENQNGIAFAIFYATQEAFPEANVQCRVHTFSLSAGFWATGMTSEAADAQQPIEIEALRISPQCRTKYEGEWLRPAQLTESERNEILDRLSVNPSRDLHKLLVEHGNNIGYRLTSSSSRDAINRALKKPIGAKHYRLASGTNRAGRYQTQLWEVRPASQ